MRALVTGAGGFLGTRVVARLLARGHVARALLRPASGSPWWPDEVEIVRTDLRVGNGLEEALDGVDVVIHLALGATADDEALLADTLVGTERLLAAMSRVPVRRLVLASSLVVYDWGRTRGTMDEESPLSTDPYRGGGYDIAKLWQERMVAEAARDAAWDAVVLRPGFIWGEGRAAIAGMGRVAGPAYLLFGPTTRLPLTHVENCADCFVTASEKAEASGQAFNVVDGDGVRVWRYVLEYARGTGKAGVPIPVPYLAGYGLARMAEWTSRALFGKKGRLPSLLTPRRFQAQFKPLRFSNRKLREVLGWSPPFGLEKCLARTYGRA